MVYDCFTFFNELDLLEIRLNILDSIVDRFVIVEAKETFTGLDKSLIYFENKTRFSRFTDKIIHVVVEKNAALKTPWERESYQRNSISKGLIGCNPDDTVLISDVDEIPDPLILSSITTGKEIHCLEQLMCYYFLNYVDVSAPWWKAGTKVLSYQMFLHGLDGISVNCGFYDPSLNVDTTTASKIRAFRHCRYVPRAGWHFSFLGGVDAIIAKIKAFSHQEYNLPIFCNEEWIMHNVERGKDIFKRPFKWFVPVRITKKIYSGELIKWADSRNDLIVRPHLWSGLALCLYPVIVSVEKLGCRVIAKLSPWAKTRNWARSMVD